ncbi:hypothetical protein FGIG_07457 [Fasciola gigantica]|uniref:Uncharacterized protein n=1 Tax=Fasciola gigantica TaxID=46835 RepID=A0A504YV02_FASGI|nr:hypothetical protein FGIG_07457 [Fasciola gigantica]
MRLLVHSATFSREFLSARLRPLCSTLFMTWRNNVMKDGGPSGTGLHSEWSRAIFEPDDWAVFCARNVNSESLFFSSCSVVVLCYGFLGFRVDFVRVASLAASCWPQEFIQLLSSWIEARTAIPITASVLCFFLSFPDMDDTGLFTSLASPTMLDWEALELFLEHVLTPLNTACQREGYHVQFESALVSWTRLFIGVSGNVVDPNIRGKLLICTSIVLQQLDIKYDAEFLVPLLSDPHFQAVATEVANLWTESMSGVVEKSVLLESLISLCFRLPQPLEVQTDLLKQLLSGVLAEWSQSAMNIPGLMGPLLTSCVSGGPGLCTALGLDQPIANMNSFDSAPVQTRITLTRNVLTLMATVRRLVEPVRLDQLEHITVPLLEPVAPSVLLVLR